MCACVYVYIHAYITSVSLPWKPVTLIRDTSITRDTSVTSVPQSPCR